jgi:hypothetical protein
MHNGEVVAVHTVFKPSKVKKHTTIKARYKTRITAVEMKFIMLDNILEYKSRRILHADRMHRDILPKLLND